MKLTGINREANTGKYVVMTNRGVARTLEFPLDSLFDWYPLDQRYEYRLSVSRDKLYLIPVEDCNGDYKYNVKSSKKRVDSRIGSFTMPRWYSKEVAKANQEIFKFAKKYDIVTPDQECTLEDIQASIERVQDVLDMLYKFEYNKLREYYTGLIDEDMLSGEAQTSYKYFLVADRETKATMVLANTESHTDNLYSKFGEVYVMLNTMRKVVG